MKLTQEVPHSRKNAINFFRVYTEKTKGNVDGKRVLDLSAGSGFIANMFLKAGADIHLYDLFPDQNTFCPRPCAPIDLQKPFPISDNQADLVICAETIEHLPDQYFFFREVSRILKPRAPLILTTPNVSSLRGRLSQFLTESEHYGYHAPTEFDAMTRWSGKDGGYFGKLFLSGVLRLRTMAALNGLRLYQIHKSESSSTSWPLLIFYPLIYFFSFKNYRRLMKGDPGNNAAYKEIFRINTSLRVLTSKHLIMEFRKME